jgi:hypothetical protein
MTTFASTTSSLDLKGFERVGAEVGDLQADA